jgi:NADH pyrophosphatase NudC (nudix superfamily)
MAEYIEREAFLADKKWLYCTDCDKRKGKKRGKMVTLYEIGEAPCKSCGIHDMLEEVEDYPSADVRPVVRGKWKVYNNTYICSSCGQPVSFWQSNFCPNCGADMRETEDEKA